MQLNIIFAIILHSYSALTIETTTTLYDQRKNTDKSLRLVFLNTSSHVEVEEGDEAVMECRVKNMDSHHTVSGLD